MNIEKYNQLYNEIKLHGADLIAVSKTKPVADILQLYSAGQKIFGENKVQEMVAKHEALPKDIEWHLIGHLQTNKVKYVVPFVSMIHSVDSFKLLQEINKQAAKNNRIINCLFQMHIADEETKYGFSSNELIVMLETEEISALTNVCICGLMGMATNTDNESKIHTEFKMLSDFFQHLKNTYFNNTGHFRHLSIGMTADYKIALQHGATLVRIGSLIFGER
jgi:pyridoxal phosphate enzyme (YggS family)